VKRSVVFWILAFSITVGTAIYQRISGPTYPMSGSVSLHGISVKYRLDRSHGGDGDHEVRIRTGSPEITGRLSWKRHKTSDDWVIVPMAFADGTLVGLLPHQPPRGKLIAVGCAPGTTGDPASQGGAVAVSKETFGCLYHPSRHRDVPCHAPVHTDRLEHFSRTLLCTLTY
jgi:hypothetical protein